ncbi:MAG: M23 family metallopeptidase [Synechococcaceae cyanobacterium SM2_3_2]|nr:M23 family metallopeptidase [Synechococcaceae cyanobacterium SM2_3_2]
MAMRISQFFGAGLGIGLAVGLEMASAAPQVRISPSEAPLGYTFVVEVTSTDPPLSDPNVVLSNPSGDPQRYPFSEMGSGRWRALLPSTPLDQPGSRSLTIEGFGQDPGPFTLSLQPRNFVTQRITLPPGSTVWASEIEWTEVNAFREQINPDKYWQGYFVRPASGPTTTPFGVRRYYDGVFAEDYYHRGLDYAGAVGSPVYAPAAGRVGLVGYESEGYQVQGNTIGIDHGQGVTSMLLHLSRIDVQEGDWVQAGQVVGGIGATGTATGPHLHWGLFIHNVAVDPIPWMNLAMP